MKKGFILPLILIIIAALVVGGGAYFYFNHTKTQPKLTAEDNGEPIPALRNFNEQITSTTSAGNQASSSSASNNSGSLKALTDTQIIETLNKSSSSNFKDCGNGHYCYESDGWHYDIINIWKGDINNDGYEDAFVYSGGCAASCGTSLGVVMNNKDSTLSSFGASSDLILGVSAQKTGIKDIKIKDGVIYITATCWYGKCDDGTKSFRLIGNVLISTDWKKINYGNLTFYLPNSFTDLGDHGSSSWLGFGTKNAFLNNPNIVPYLPDWVLNIAVAVNNNYDVSKAECVETNSTEYNPLFYPSKQINGRAYSVLEDHPILSGISTYPPLFNYGRLYSTYTSSNTCYKIQIKASMKQDPNREMDTFEGINTLFDQIEKTFQIRD
jgi:hypothetical protein